MGSRRVRIALGASAALLLLAAAVVAGVVAKTNPSARHQLQMTEKGAVSVAFAKHSEDLLSAKVGDSESPTSWAEEQYQLNGGDQITADNILGAQAAFSAIAQRGVGQGKNSTSSWFSLGP